MSETTHRQHLTHRIASWRPVAAVCVLAALGLIAMAGPAIATGGDVDRWADRVGRAAEALDWAADVPLTRHLLQVHTGFQYLFNGT